MPIGRRTLLIGASALVGAAIGGDANACSLVATRRPRRFDDRLCRREIERLVEMLNQAPSLPKETVEDWVGERGIAFDDALTGGEDAAAFLQGFKRSAGVLDSKPIRLAELDLVRRRGIRAAYAFSLRRFSYHPADPEGCNGLFVHDEFWGEDETGYIAAFHGNRMQTLRPFPEWFAGVGGA